MQQIAAFVKRQGWTQVEAASHCGVTQRARRINDLVRGPGLALLAGRVGEHLHGAGLPRAGRILRPREREGDRYLATYDGANRRATRWRVKVWAFSA